MPHKLLRHARVAMSLSALPLLLAGCGVTDTDDDGGDFSGRVIENTSRLELAGTSPRTAPPVASVRADEAARATPLNLSGDLCYAFLSLGELGPGMFPMTWLAPAETFPYGPTSGTGSTVQFDLATPVDVSNFLLVPESADAMPEAHKIIRAELCFNYVDTEFTLGEPPQTYRVRTVYAATSEADDAQGTMHMGDKLILLPGTEGYQWANANGTSPVRADVVEGLIQDATVTEYDNLGEGNPAYVPVTANFHEELDVTYELITDTSKTWVLDFDLSDAIVWSADPATFTSPMDILEAFRLKFGPNRTTTQGEEDDGIRADLRIE